MRTPEEEHQHDDERCAHRDLLPAADVEVDLVPDHARLRRAREEIRRVVVAEHRERDDRAAREHGRDRERERHQPERLVRARAQVTRRFEQAPVDTVEERVEREDHERHVPVDEAEDHRRRSSVEPRPRLADDADPEQHAVHPAVVLEEVDPGEHPHQVADEERRDQAQQEESLPAAAVAGDEVRDRVGDDERERSRDEHVDERAHEDRLERAVAREELAGHEAERARVPIERVPGGDRRLQDRVDRPEGDAEHRVERDQEEDADPDDARQREDRPGGGAATPPPGQGASGRILRHPP